MKDTDDDNNNVIHNKRSISPKTGEQISGSDNNTNDSSLKEIKRQAAILFNKQKYNPAIVKYTQIIKMCPNDPKYYAHRAASYMMLGKDIEALKDAQKSVELDSTCIDGHCRVIRCAIRLHEFSEMERSLEKLKVIDPTNEVLQYHAEKMQELVVNLENESVANAAKDHLKVLEYIDKSLAICPQYLFYKVKKAECLVNLRRFKEAETLADDILRRNPNNSDSHYILGRCSRSTNIEKSVKHFEEAFRLNPHCTRDRQSYESGKKFLERKTEANNAYYSQNFAEAYSQYSSLSLDCPDDTEMTITILFNMAQASYKLGYLQRCVRKCSLVLVLNPNHLKALMRRAQCHMDRMHFSKAIEDLEKSWSIESSAEVLTMLQEAYKLLGASHDGSYVILGVVQGASKEVITKAYKELTKLHHPDRHANATDEQKKYHEVKCKEITRAYRLLMDQKAADHTNSSTDASQGKKSAGGFNTNSTHNNTQQSSSGATNNYSTGSQSSSGRGTHDNSQRSSSEKENNKSTGTKSSARSSNSYNEQSSSSGYKPSPRGYDNQKSSSKSYYKHSSPTHRDYRKQKHSPSRRHDDRWYKEDNGYDSDRYDAYGRPRSQKSRKRSYNQY